ncbi:hypothetical protein T4A_374 [Trichinella pseudospiralis]|uniref:Uncharacterized protein n=1 Tax=Trichinella pseudospiralis TaxID=6337 RepID=A0A0V1DJZ6_TRIPS|nr:hypothetical protein T4A_374 [Trichinella pseudospiralis]
MFVAFFVVIFYPLPWIMLYASVLNPYSESMYRCILRSGLLSTYLDNAFFTATEPMFVAFFEVVFYPLPWTMLYF